MSRDENDPNGELVLREVLEVYETTAYDLQTLRVIDEEGNIEEFGVTDEHPFFVEGEGWTAAALLEVGQSLIGSDGTRLTVVENLDDKRPDGVQVYNFHVDGTQTYFVADGVGNETWTWVHNDCEDARKLRANLKKAGHSEPSEKNWAAHIVPTGAFSRNADVASAVKKSQDIVKKALGDLNDARNGFFSINARHDGTHTHEYLFALRDKLVALGPNPTAQAVTDALGQMKVLALSGRF